MSIALVLLLCTSSILPIVHAQENGEDPLTVISFDLVLDPNNESIPGYTTASNPAIRSNVAGIFGQLTDQYPRAVVTLLAGTADYKDALYGNNGATGLVFQIFRAPSGQLRLGVFDATRINPHADGRGPTAAIAALNVIKDVGNSLDSLSRVTVSFRRADNGDWSLYVNDIKVDKANFAAEGGSVSQNPVANLLYPNNGSAKMAFLESDPNTWNVAAYNHAFQITSTTARTRLENLEINDYGWEPPDEPPVDENGLIDYILKIRPDFKFGMHVPIDALSDPKAYNFLIKNANAATTGIYMMHIQPGQTPQNWRWEWSPIEKQLPTLNNFNFWVKFHPMLGDQAYTSGWVQNNTFTNAQIRSIMEERIKTVCERYQGNFDALDVCNEAIRSGVNLQNLGLTPDMSPPFNFPDNFWNTANSKWAQTGFVQNQYGRAPAYLIEAHELAAQYAGDGVEFIYNDYGNSMMGKDKSDATYLLMRYFKHAGIPVNSVGFQLHCRVRDGVLYEGSGENTTSRIDFDAIRANIRRYAGLGVDVHISEFDIHLMENRTAEDFRVQAQAYCEFMKLALEEPNVKSFIIWGISDQVTASPFSYYTSPRLLDRNNDPKPVYYTLLNMLREMAAEYDNTPITAIMRIDNLYAAVNGEKVRVNDAQELAPIFNEGGRTMVPFRFIATCFGADVDWSDSLGSVIINHNSKNIRLLIGLPYAYVDGVQTPINAPAQIMTFGRTFVPFRAVSELLGGINLEYDPGSMTIIASDGEIDVAKCVAEFDALMG